MQITQGMEYFFSGFKLISQKGLKRFVLIPLLINILLFGSSLFFLFGWLSDGFNAVTAMLPEWLSWLEWLMWPIAVTHPSLPGLQQHMFPRVLGLVLNGK